MYSTCSEPLLQACPRLIEAQMQDTLHTRMPRTMYMHDDRVEILLIRRGEGDVDFDRIFKTLREIGFNEQEDTIATFNPLGFPERAISDGVRTREIIEQNLVGVPSIAEPMPEDYGMYAR